MRELMLSEIGTVHGGGKGLKRAIVSFVIETVAGAVKDMIDNAEEGQVDMGDPKNLANVYGA